MKNIRQLIFRNLIRSRRRSLALALLAAVLAAALLDGTVILNAMRGAFTSLQDRLGADIMVVPYAALSKKNYDNEMLLGTVGNFYLPGKTYEGIRERDGAADVCARFYLTSEVLPSGSDPVHLIGCDPGTDFVLTPWIGRGRVPKSGMEALAGADVPAQTGETLTFFGITLTVTGKLDRTGTDMDSSVFTDRETIHLLAQASGDERLQEYDSMDEGHAVTCVLVRTAKYYDTESVKNDINIHFKKVRAIRSKQVIGSVAGGTGGVSGAVRAALPAVWIIVLAALTAACVLLTHERRPELALLRMLGISAGRLSRIAAAEECIVCLAGSAAGTAAGLLLLPLIRRLLEARLQLTGMLPGAAGIALCVLMALTVPAAAGGAAAGLTARRIGAKDAGALLRSEE